MKTVRRARWAAGVLAFLLAAGAVHAAVLTGVTASNAKDGGATEVFAECAGPGTGTVTLSVYRVSDDAGAPPVATATVACNDKTSIALSGTEGPHYVLAELNGRQAVAYFTVQRPVKTAFAIPDAHPLAAALAALAALACLRRARDTRA